MQRRRLKSHCLFQLKSQVHILNRLPRRTLHQVVDDTFDDDTSRSLIQSRCNIAKISSAYHLGLGKTIGQNTHERGVLVKVGVSLDDLVLFHVFYQPSVYVSENAPT